MAHFRIPGASSIQSSGLSEVNRAEVLPVFGEDIGRNIFFVSLSRAAQAAGSDSLGAAGHGHAFSA
jgi:hypothetical protein